MNNSRRKRIYDSLADLNMSKDKLELALYEERQALDRLSDDEEYDNMRDGMEEIISGLEDTLTNLEDAINTLEGAYF